jgi:hypothetical protein
MRLKMTFESWHTRLAHILLFFLGTAPTTDSLRGLTTSRDLQLSNSKTYREIDSLAMQFNQTKINRITESNGRRTETQKHSVFFSVRDYLKYR